MNAVAFDARAVHRQISGLVAVSLLIGQNPCCRMIKTHQAGSLYEQCMAVQIVATAKVVDTSWQ